MWQKGTDKGWMRKAAWVFATRLLLVGVGFFIKILQTQYLGPEKYGYYALFATIIGMGVFLFRFGFFASYQVLLAETDNRQEQRNLSGTAFLLVGLNGLLFAAFLFLTGFWVDALFDVQIGRILQWVSPFCIFLPFQFFISAWGMGTGNVQHTALFDTLSKVFYLISLLVLVGIGAFSLEAAIVLNVASFGMGTLLILVLVHPTFQDLGTSWRSLWRKTRTYGYHMYLGSTLNNLTFRLDEVLISAWVNTTQLGFYTLSAVICSPMNMLSQASSQALFKRFAGASSISRNILILNLGWLLLAGTFLWLAGDRIVDWVLGPEYATVADYLPWMVVAYLFFGLYQPYLFLTAKSLGKQVRNAAYVETGVNVIGNLVFIPIYGVYGALGSTIGAKAVHFAVKHYYYLQYLKIR
ncbi:MAG: oligosaccharide flippase family protein [Leptolyngbya sp. SIO3F4]|nr:oligosaccharide flippase family protein [Leptolyngbya sp. SIO3F4]